MECEKILELITASLDGQINQSERLALDAHLPRCPRCKIESDLEAITKTVTRSYLPWKQTPPDVSSRISHLINQRIYSPLPASSSIWSTVFTIPVRKTIFALGGSIAVFVLILNLIPSNIHHTHGSPKDGNIIHQTYNNYDGIVEGSFAPQVASDDPGVVKSFFTDKTNFKVSVPRLKHCTLIGGMSSFYDDECVAHVVYKYGNNVVYLYETRIDSVMNGLNCSLNLPDNVKNDLRKTGWYVESHVPDCTLIIWQPDSTTLCCAVAEVDQEQLWSCLKDEN
ncbi:MAG: anti-sigma factor family protein [Bacteroidota bacterium]